MDGVSSVAAPGLTQSPAEAQAQAQAQAGTSAGESELINQAAGQTAASFLMHLHNEQKKALEESSKD